MMIVRVIILLVLTTSCEAASFGSIQSSDDEINADLFEGDILLTADVRERLQNLQATGDPGRSSANGKQHNANRNRAGLWVTKIVPYEIPQNWRAELEGTINVAIKQYHEKTCLRFVKRTTEGNWIRFVRKSGCWSSVGKNRWPGVQEISLGQGCNGAGTVMHEMMHAIGFWHEQSRPDRDRFVEIFWENIPLGKQHNFRRYSHGSVDTLGTNYDFTSLMHYSGHAFSKNGQVTIRPINKPGVRLGQRIRLSEIDVIKINAIYDCRNSGSGVWSQWSEFSPCSSLCEKYRQRFCSSQDRAKDCPAANQYGIETETLKCPDKECYAPVDGHWGRWSSWTKCSSSCGHGKRHRTRTCDDPRPKHGGKDCTGIKAQSKDCLYKKCGLGPDDCDFEDEAGWCIWRNVVQQRPWYLHSGPTPSSVTGPAGDNSGLKGGHYIYFESSSPVQPGETGIVESKLFAPTLGKCMKFYYSMNGDQMGTLSLIAQGTDGSNRRTLWEKTGNQGQSWHYVNVTIIRNAGFKVFFTAKKGLGFHSDMAVDDISFKNQSCSSLISTAKPTSSWSTEEPSTIIPSTTELPATWPKTTDHFMIYSSAHNKCIGIDGLSKVSAGPCALMSPNELWKWTEYGQLQNIFTLGCLTASDPPQDWARVKLAVCDKDNGRQIWSCSGEFVRLTDTTFNLNYGNTGEDVVLFTGTGDWSKWKLFKEDKSICEKRKDKLSTLPPTQSTVQTKIQSTTRAITSTQPPTTTLQPTTAKPTQVTTATQSVKGFLIYNADHDKCVSIENKILTVRSCDTKSTDQMWRWTQYGQLQSAFNLSCLSAPDTPTNWDRVQLFTCDPHDRHQVWACADKFLRLNGTILNLNYGNHQGGDSVVLFQGTGDWSKWKIYGEDVYVCEKQKDVVVSTTPAPVTTPQPTTKTSAPSTDVTTATPSRRTNQFLIYNVDLDKCVTIENSIVTARPCDLPSPNKVWRWTPFGQLQNMFTLQCLSTPEHPENWDRVDMVTCDRRNASQIWTCADDFLKLKGTILNLNFGNLGDYVVLFQGTGDWSKWQVFGEGKNVCEKQKGFQVYIPAHDKCMSVNNDDVIATSCDIDEPNQWWTWTKDNQVRNQNLNKCLDVNGDVKDWTKLSVSICDHLTPSQLWSCDYDLVHVIDTNLNMNYGNLDGPGIVLFHGTREYSQWKIFGTSANICAAKA